MSLISIKIYNFRNLEDSTIKIEGKDIFFIGENAQGKTNALELVYLLCCGAGFKNSSDSECIKFGNSNLKIEGVFSEKNNEHVTVLITNKNKSIKIDGKECRDRAELIERHPCIAFRHQDIDFINGTPEHKRWFFDQTISLVSNSYMQELREYKKILKARNISLLSFNDNLLDIYDMQLAIRGKKIQKERKEIIEKFNTILTPGFFKVSKIESPLTVEYKPSWLENFTIDELLALLKEKRKQDVLMKTTTTGPHRDRYSFLIEGKDFSKFASTGQKRLLSLLLRISQAEYYTKTTKREPILLLDDVLLELDPEKRKGFFHLLPIYEQAFFTFLPGEHYLSYCKPDTIKFLVKNGRFENS